MKTKSLLLTLLLAVSVLLSACAKETESTVSGMVVKKEGTVIYLLDFNSINIGESRPTGDDTDGSRPSRPDGDADGSRPSRPEGDFNPDDTNGSRPERPNREERGGRGERNRNIDESKLTKIDIADAHISIEIDEGKEAGTIDDVKEGSRVTITLKGEKPTNVLVSSSSRNGKGFGNGNGNRNNDNRKRDN